MTSNVKAFQSFQGKIYFKKIFEKPMRFYLLNTVLSKRIGTLANVSLPFLAITLHVFVLLPSVAAHMKAEIIGYTMQLN